MKTNYILNESKEHTCVALGFFDGIHLGHQAVISTAIKKAQLTNTFSTVFTFSEHPKNIIKNTKIKNIITPQQKENLLCSMGVSLLYCIDFFEVMNLSPEEFVKRILIDVLHAKYICCGFNYRFGKGACADYIDLANICERYGIKVHAIEPVSTENTIISSSNIRKLIESGNIKSANKMLGHHFSLEFPTACEYNLSTNAFKIIINQVFPDDFIVPRYGVYKSYTVVNTCKYYSISVIDSTKNASNLPRAICKTYLINYKGNLENKNVKVLLAEFLSNDKNFNNIAYLATKNN